MPPTPPVPVLNSQFSILNSHPPNPFSFASLLFASRYKRGLSAPKARQIHSLGRQPQELNDNNRPALKGRQTAIRYRCFAAGWGRRKTRNPKFLGWVEGH